MNKIKSIIFIVIIQLLITSCAGLGIGNKARSEFDKGLNLFNRAQYTEAIPYFESATIIDPDYYDAYLYLGRSFVNTGQFVKSLNPLRTAYNLSPEKTRGEVTNILMDSLFHIATSSLKEGNLSIFKSNLDEIIELGGNTEKTKVQLAQDLIDFGLDELSSGNTSSAIETFKSALNMTPGNFDAYLALSKAYFKEGNITKALNNAKKAVQINPDSQEALKIYNSFGQ